MLKKKTFIIILIISILLVSNSAFATSWDKDKENLLGPVKRITYLSDESTITTIKTFRKDGSIETLESRFRSGVFFQKYDQKDGVKKQIPKIVTGTFERGTTVSKYNDNGLIVEKKYFTYDGALSNIVDYVYDTHEKLMEENWCKPDGVLSGKYQYVYDENGRRIEESRYRADGMLTDKEEFIYDYRGRLVEEKRYGLDYKPVEVVLKFRRCSDFDENGKEIETRIYSRSFSQESNTIITYSKFDKYGNWQKAVATYDTEEPIKIAPPLILRKIEYY